MYTDEKYGTTQDAIYNFIAVSRNVQWKKDPPGSWFQTARAAYGKTLSVLLDILFIPKTVYLVRA